MLNALIRTAESNDTGQCLDCLTLAFGSDPPCRWIWPDPQQYLKAFPRFAQAFGGGAIEVGTAHIHGGHSGVALWLPPDTPPDEEAVIGVFEETVDEKKKEALFSMFEQMGTYHPTGPHWHLPLIGVDPASQGQGLGSALLSHALTQCDRDKLPAYLEATSPRNVALYKRHGFEILGTIQVEDSPPITPMLRKPQ